MKERKKSENNFSEDSQECEGLRSIFHKFNPLYVRELPTHKAKNRRFFSFFLYFGIFSIFLRQALHLYVKYLLSIERISIVCALCEGEIERHILPIELFY